MEPGVAIIGMGNWGTSLAHALLRAGIPVREVLVRKGALAGRSSFHRVTIADATLDAETLWLCVPDAAIASACRSLVRRRPSLRGQTVVHSSGALDVTVLQPAKQAGAAVASVHPVMSFPTPRPVALAGVSFGVEAEPSATRRLSALVRCLGGRPFAVTSEHKALYHAVGTLVSPLLVSHLAAAEQVAALAGLRAETRSMLGPIAQATLTNFLTSGVEKSFSGPLARGDIATIELHLRALEPHPLLGEIYQSMARYAVKNLPVRNRRRMKLLLDGMKAASNTASDS